MLTGGMWGVQNFTGALTTPRTHTTTLHAGRGGRYFGANKLHLNPTGERRPVNKAAHDARVGCMLSYHGVCKYCMSVLVLAIASATGPDAYRPPPPHFVQGARAAVRGELPPAGEDDGREAGQRAGEQGGLLVDGRGRHWLAGELRHG